MNILLINTGNVLECLISSSIIKSMRRKYNNINFWIIVDNDINCKNIFKYNKNVKKVFFLEEVYKIPYDLFNNTYDKIINLNCKNYVIGFFEDILENSHCEKLGIGFNENSDFFFDVIYGNKKTNKNLFQVYFNLAGLTWKGEGYDFFYRPKTKSKKNKIGFALANKNLRNYVLSKLEIDEKNIWTIPFKKNIYKACDEINRCKYIISDDFLTINLACCLRKDLLFLKCLPFNYKIELFKKDSVLEVPKYILQ